MSSRTFPVNDLLRRKLQTSLTITTLTLSITATLFLLLFSSRLDLGIATASGTLTLGLTAIFSQFLLFIGVLIFAVGAVLTSFIVFLMMTQRTRDFGLIKAAGCPNSLVAGYFLTELLITTSAGCILGIVFGFLADFAVANWVFQGYVLPNFGFAPAVFAAFFALSLVFGIKPLLNAAKMSPVAALSPVNYYGLASSKRFKPTSRSALTWRVASRSLARRQSATIRIAILLSIVFMLLTVSIAGGIIASDTTVSWVELPVKSDIVAIAYSSMGNQYQTLLSKFSGAKETDDFDYSDPNLAIPEAVIGQLNALSGISLVDSRLVLHGHVREISNFTIDPETLTTLPVGDRRQGESLIIGVDPQKLTGDWSMQGRFLLSGDELEAVIGDSIAHLMYSPNPVKRIFLSDPLVQSIEFQNRSFRIVGICIDPLNNGEVTYVDIAKLGNITCNHKPNLLLIKLNDQVDRVPIIAEIKSIIQAADQSLDVFELKETVEANKNFLSSTWSTIMLLPLFTLASAALCLVGYIILSLDEQRQEFAILRAVGAKPKIVIEVLSIQSLIVLASSFAVGTSFGIMTTLIILMANPLVTSFTVLVIAAWLTLALAGMFLLSLYPALRFAKASILKIMA